VLVLGLETSTRRGSVALVESGVLLAEAWHDELNAHVERLPGLIDEVFARAQRERAQLGRVAVGRGPGAFTGLRVGLALAQGIAAGLGIPAVGIGSLRARAAAVPQALTGRRWIVLDARRGDVFLACYGGDGAELVHPLVLAREQLPSALDKHRGELGIATTADWLIGPSARELADLAKVVRGYSGYESEATSFPSAGTIARIASHINENDPPSPEYLRDADAIIPNLPPCPLDQPTVATPPRADKNVTCP
jgi:tRNA threonylcarbamoyladenosine biosynthesis protein TsaB